MHVFVILLALVIVALGSWLYRTTLRNAKLRQQTLEHHRQQMQTTLDSLTEAVMVVSPGCHLVFINQAARRMFGIQATQGQRRDLISTFELRLPDGMLLPPERWPCALALNGEFLHRYEVQVVRMDTRKTVLAEISTYPIRNSEGQIDQAVVICRDITQPREVDQAFARFAAIIASSEDAIISKDSQGIVTSWNGGAEKLFGYTAEEMVGNSIRILLPADRVHEEDDILTRIQRGETVDHIETVRRRKNGQIIHVSLTISPILDAAGKTIGASKIARNITEKKLVEERLQQSQKLEAIGQLTGGIAHDFNNLLGVVLGNLDLLEQRVNGDETAMKRIHTAQKAANRGADLTKRLLAFSSREKLHPEPVELADPIESTIGLAARGIGPEINIVTHLDRTIPPVMVDAGGLENALLDILINARDAMPGGGQITITTQQASFSMDDVKAQTGGLQPGEYAVITISDTGLGMSREILQRVFEPFYTTKERAKGTGLGLAMVYGFFRQSGGAVRIDSEVGCGTTVSCYLPILETSIGDRSKTNPAVREASSQGGTILLVDDEAGLLEVAATHLERQGYTVLQAENGEAGLKLVRENPEIDLMVTDVIMPGGMNGAELAHHVRSLRPFIKIIYTSGYPADALAERRMRLADGPLLRKPYQRAELIALVGMVLAGQVTNGYQAASR